MGCDIMVKISVAVLWDLNTMGFREKMISELKIPTKNLTKKFHELTDSIKKQLMDKHYGKDHGMKIKELDDMSKSLKVKR